MRLLVTGVTRTGNLGGTAMLCALEDVLATRVEDFALASILPTEDRAQSGPDNARIIAADYRLWLLLVAPLCIILWPLRRLAHVRSLISRLPIMRDFSKADSVADLSGIAFVDGRGLALLYYNVAVALPALFLDKPVHKLSQALGPFERPLNRAAAQFILWRCRSVAARGLKTLHYLRRLGLSTAEYRPDTSFALTVFPKTRDRARAQITAVGCRLVKRPLVVVSPSAVVARYCAREGKDLISILTAAIADLQQRGMSVALLPHSTNTGISKNDDFGVVSQIAERAVARGHAVARLDPEGDPRLARALIAEADVFIAFRFHTLIAALSQGVPVLTIGWSHKYAEAAEPFGMAEFTCSYKSLDADHLVQQVMSLLSRRDELTARMEQAADAACQGARAGIEVVLAEEGS